MSDCSSAVWYCKHCGLLVEELNNSHNVNPVCCGEAMSKLKCNTSDGSVEKHVPQVSSYTTAEHGYKTGILVKVGSLPHPMVEDHFIEWIEVIDNDRLIRVKLKPNDAPEAFFEVSENSNLIVRAYCNKHGLWQNK
jgi:superoxide reductase